jgi:hypothetical protein
MTRSAAPREAAVVAAVMKRMAVMISEGVPLRVEKQHGSVWARVGRPDLDGCLAGRALKIEVKRLGAKPTSIQKKALHDWRQVGAIAFWSDDPEEIEEELRLHWGIIVTSGRNPSWPWKPILKRLRLQVAIEDAERRPDHNGEP